MLMYHKHKETKLEAFDETSLELTAGRCVLMRCCPKLQNWKQGFFLGAYFPTMRERWTLSKHHQAMVLGTIV